ncbi:hypothetical protein CIB95_06030 [Lottiidibacillus patelloidae]|uniref:Phosphatidylglycerol lysyltransferase n=1 Tax=Lottiidibacillus patelloidae TaxID=2670334 RepID=A0A263BWH0_9BACI|nr:lysylphosphatidylglycerol synthase transmembrane domain-containing protein [Lottiidibacillus patelloidae]OZM57912.1 hypothetical protein CIB95_06030 [Lottiidibacillus patelloidae]
MSGQSSITLIKRTISLLLIVLFLVISFYWFDSYMLWKHTIELFTEPKYLIIMTIFYTIAFFLRAFAWWLYLEKKPTFRVCISGLFYSMFFNHILPFKVGDAVRIGALAKEKKVKFTKAVQSVIVLRIIDVVILGIFAFIGFIVIAHILPFKSLLVAYVLLGMFIMVAIILLKRKSTFISRFTSGMKKTLVSKNGIAIIGVIFLSWICEGVVIFTITKLFSEGLTPLSSIWLNSVSVISGLFQVTPGGIATYETVMSIALVNLGFKMEDAYHLAILSHGYKFLYSFLVGFIAFILVPLKIREIKQWIRNGVKGEESK